MENSKMTTVQIFNNSEFGEIRTVIIGGKDYFYGIDVADALMYKRPRKAVIDHCKGVLSQDGGVLGQDDEPIIPEGDIYRLIVKASEQNNNKEIKEKAEKFERWIFDEVLPELRRTGIYAMKGDCPTTEHPGEVANLIKQTSRLMERQSIEPHKVAENAKLICMQFGIRLSDEFVKIPEYHQMNLLSDY